MHMSDFNQIWSFWAYFQISKSPTSDSRAYTFRQTEEETDIHDDIIGVPRDYANAPENE
jgi:hypothetical protein